MLGFDDEHFLGTGILGKANYLGRKGGVSKDLKSNRSRLGQQVLVVSGSRRSVTTLWTEQHVPNNWLQ